jgi:hypothetical protein
MLLVFPFRHPLNDLIESCGTTFGSVRTAYIEPFLVSTTTCGSARFMPYCPNSSGGIDAMAKRKKTDTVQLKLRIREELRQKLQNQANGREVSLNNEMVRRLEQSFNEGSIGLLFDAFTGSQKNTHLLAMIASTLNMIQISKQMDDKKPQFAAAVISKIVESYLSSEKLSHDSFPQRDIPGSADGLAAVILHLHQQFPYQWGRVKL